MHADLSTDLNFFAISTLIDTLIKIRYHFNSSYNM